jgi:lipid II:glycine glycyltransferase (peptidoglycan interpeptide bridge formation enzyme)
VGYFRSPFFTKTIDLCSTLNEIESHFDPKTKYEVRRAIKDGISTHINGNPGDFIKFYNAFAKTKGLGLIHESGLAKYQSDLLITYAVSNAQVVVMHAYVTDRSAGRARLLYSASLFRNEQDASVKAVIGRANRLLHAADISFFKTDGFIVYDLGGYAPNTTDDALININQFKDSFGGTLVKETDYQPLLAVAASFFKRS